MVLKPDQQKMQQLLSEAITVLCKNGLNYDSHVNVEALIGITLDDNEVMLVSVRETIQNFKQHMTPSTQGAQHSVRPRITPNRKRPASVSSSSMEPVAKKTAPIDDDVIHIKGEIEAEDSNDTIIEEQEQENVENTQGEWQDQGGGGDEQFTNYDENQFSNFETDTMTIDDDKAAVFANQTAVGQIPPPIPNQNFMTPTKSNAKSSPGNSASQRWKGNGIKYAKTGLNKIGLLTIDEALSKCEQETSWKCSACSMSFPKKSNLKSHMKGHLRQLDFKCPHCDKKFWNEVDLSGHISAKHTNIKLHVCPQCGKSFSYRKTLVRHIKCFCTNSPLGRGQNMN